MATEKSERYGKRALRRLLPLGEQLVPPLGLRIRFVLDLEPAISTWLVYAQLAFSDYAFQISFANFLKEVPTVLFDVLCVQEPIASAGLNQLRADFSARLAVCL